MKRSMDSCLCLLLLLVLSSCTFSDVTITPMRTQTRSPSHTLVSSESSSTIQPVHTTTVTSFPTLDPHRAEDAIGRLLREPEDCTVPCFWGIIPEYTTLDDANKLLAHLGLQLKHTNTRDSKEFYGVIYDSDNGLRITPVLTIQNEMVQNIRVGISPESQQMGVARQWLAYSPETLIKQYGVPSRVDFFVGRAAPAVSYAMILYFEPMNLIVEYGGYDVDVGSTSFRVCPLIDQQDNVSIWFGKKPEDPPGAAIPLKDASLLTVDTFSQLMTGNPDHACIDLRKDSFP